MEELDEQADGDRTMSGGFALPPDRAELDALVQEALKHKMTPAEIREQRVSFVYGMMSFRSTMTKDEVRTRLAEIYGEP
jgi:hypothetical protein